MPYNERWRNNYDKHVYDSPEERAERFERLLERQKFLEEKELYEYERRKDEGV